ncbi:MAG: enoyl-CoA hydratase/isomerase family protein [Sphingobium sp.]
MEDPILVTREGAAGRIRLNSPATGNAMTSAAIDSISAALDAFARDEAVALVLIDHVGERGFCVGGDALGLAKSGRADGEWARDYFRRQYAMNAAIHDFPKPVVTIADGAVIGGGLGLLLPARHRIVTERTMLAFMETMVGMAPDVGASWFLPRLPGFTGRWLALTGAKVMGADCVRRGLADLCIDSGDLPAFVDKILNNREAMASIIPAPVPAEPDGDAHRLFGGGDLPAVIAALEADPSPWAAKQLGAIRRASPTATLATWALLEQGAAATDLAAALAQELTLNARLVRGHDFLSFARANLLEKDQPLTWSPGRIEDVAP